jgi:hypothetical protein
MSKLITVNLGGKQRTLDVGKFWFTKYFGEARGEDPLSISDLLNKPEGQFDFVTSLVYAGLRTSYKVSKTPEDFTKEDVESWIGEMESKDVAELVDKYVNLVSAPGEAPAPENGA